ncbi:hypothetical protein NEPAR06_0113 [Nematocida parisii]|uniref:uncharacterized protein n=1 Tax=Nematocida parisii (strain ERTm1 / ATCC PRA-289) TaxID=881290 RepID=UPI000264B377|nr:uncharacterized protein NEPG_00143 [Nematocida parisii ERTm1]EIJ94621.1 hypothetical protein NEPG_00143 [Nematocida parisii ERTm1]KAI5152992.1 hypothetical protein NEPAR06_0113 [Nematocida parisii]|eukprot:XP_013057977.1 hypothetical protein NEPG_00143 [Nematocida parisii ERTm1]
MEGYIDEEILRIELQKEFGEKEGEIEDEDIEKIYKIVIDINKRTPVFKDLPEPLTNLAYNIFYMQIYNRTFFCDYKDIISEINDSITQTSEIIDMIKEEAEALNSGSKKEAFYKLISNNHSIMASVYRHRKNFYDSSINVLCEKADRSELGEEIPSEDAILKLYELTESGECSRLQKVLDILIKHGDKLTIVDKDGEEQSNVSDLKLTDDDIYSLQLLARTERSDFDSFTYDIINGLIYNLIQVQDKDKKLHTSIAWLYYTIYKMSTMEHGFSLGKDENKDRIKTCVDQLNNMESIDIIDNKSILTLLGEHSNVLDHKDFNINNFRNNVLPGYLKSIISDVCGITGKSIKENTKNRNGGTIDTSKNKETGGTIDTSGTTIKGMRTTTIIFMAIIMIVIMIVFSIIFLYPNETNKIMNILNIM